MRPTLPRGRALPLATLALIATAASVAAAPFHLGLARSEPADKATVHHVPEVRLWFTEAPAADAVSIRLIDAGGEPVPTADPVADPKDGKVFSIALPDGLAAGRYTVAWRGMGDDGHVVRGEFSFTVAGH